MPDVMLIPAIASFFGVSTDELFDYDLLTMKEKIENIVTKAASLRKSNPARAEKILRQGLKQFPGNEIILNNLLYTMRSPERSEEVISLCKGLAESTKEDAVRYDALRILAETYHECGQQDLVKPTLQQIPELYFTKLELMAELLLNEDSLYTAKQQAWLSYKSLIEMLEIMRIRYEQFHHQEMAEHCKIARNKVVDILKKELPELFENSDAEECVQMDVQKLA